MATVQRFTHHASLLEQSLSANYPDLLKEYLLSCKIRNMPQSTINTYTQRLSVFCDYLAANEIPEDVRQITKRHVQFYILYLKDKRTRQHKPLKEVVINSYYRSLHTFFEWAKEDGIIEHSPMDNLHPPAFTPTEIKVFSMLDISALLLLCQRNVFTDIRNKAIILMAFDTGLRLNEISSLKMSDVSLSSGLINVTYAKGRKHRVVRIGSEAKRALMRYIRWRNYNHSELWQTEERTPLTYCGMSIAIRRLCKRAEITDARGSMHTFRHSAALYSLSNGAELIDVQKMLGHAKIRTTADIYLSAFDSQMVAKRHERFSPVDRMMAEG